MATREPSVVLSSTAMGRVPTHGDLLHGTRAVGWDASGMMGGSRCHSNSLLAHLLLPHWLMGGTSHHDNHPLSVGLVLYGRIE